MFLKIINFKISKNKRGKFIPNFTMVNMRFLVNQAWATTKDHRERRIKMSLLRATHQNIRMLWISCSITVRLELSAGNFKIEGIFIFYKPWWKRFSSNDYSTCIILLTGLYVFFLFFLLFHRSTCNMVLITAGILNGIARIFKKLRTGLWITQSGLQNRHLSGKCMFNTSNL